MKKIILISLLCLGIYLVIRGCAPIYVDQYILDGYVDKFSLDTGSVPDFSIYEKYYYEDNMDYKFIDSGWYHKIEENNIKYISEYFDDINV